MSNAYTRYEDVMWYRRSWANNLFVLLGLFGCFPLVAWTCVNLLTGQVYVNGYDGGGQIKTWGIVNKVWAVLFALVSTGFFANVGYEVVTRQGGQPLAVTSTNEPGWEKFASDESLFTVSFPGTPKKQERKADGEMIDKNVSFSAERNDISYQVVYHVYAKKFIDVMDTLDPEDFAKRQREATVKNTEGEVLVQKDILLGNEKRPGYELLIQVSPSVFIRQRAFYANGKLYQLLVTGMSRDAVTAAAADKFVDSFRLEE